MLDKDINTLLLKCRSAMHIAGAQFVEWTDLQYQTLFHLMTLLSFQFKHRYCKIQIHIQFCFPKSMTSKTFGEDPFHN